MFKTMQIKTLFTISLITIGKIKATALRSRSRKEITGDFSFTRVFTQEDGKWKVALFHNTIIKPIQSMRSKI